MNKVVAQRSENVAEARKGSKEKVEVEKFLELGEYLMMKRVLVNLEEKVHEPTQMKSMFRTVCKSQGKCCKVGIESGSTNNLVSTKMVEKLGLSRMKHPTPYKVSWLQKGHQLLVNEQCKLELQIGAYKNVWLCDIISMDVCHIHL